MRTTLAFLMLALTGGALLAADGVPRFLIERIDVRNTRHASPAIIRAETRLHEGQSYTEADLREASYRVARLPFVLDAQYSLEKGSRRDAYVFVITVTETKPLFFSAQLNAFLGEDNNVGTTDLLVGGRFFAGTRGVFHAAVGTFDRPGQNTGGDIRTVQAGYTHYDLFGTRAFATVDLTRRFDNSYAGTTPDISLLIGVPLGPNQTLSLRGARSRSEYSRRVFVGGEVFRSTSTSQYGALTWTYDTTNSPFFPTRGALVSLSGQTGRTETSGLFFDPRGRATTRQTMLGFSATKYWELSERNSISGRFEGQGGRTTFESSTEYPSPYRPFPTTRGNYQTVTADFSHSFFDNKKTRAAGDSRIDVLAGVSRTATYYPRPGDDRVRTAPVIGAWWARRTAWGLVRIGASYQW